MLTKLVRRRLMRLKIGSLLVISAMLVSGVLGLITPVHGATSSLNITGPLLEPTISDGNFTIKGSFRSTAIVKKVQISVCYLKDSDCYAYLYDQKGAITRYEKLFTAELSASGASAGDYSLAFKDVGSGLYNIKAYLLNSDGSRSAAVNQQFFIDRTGKTPKPPIVNASKGYITIMWGRTNWQATKTPDCAPLPGARTLQQNADDLKARDLTAVGGVVVGRTNSTGLSCFSGYTLQPSWQELAMLRDNYGWSFVSQGMDYLDMTQLDSTQKYNESVATLKYFEDNGHDRAWGAFNYPKNKYDSASYSIVNQSFAFGRKYWDGRNTRDSVTDWPRAMSTNSVNGGRCNNPNLACYNMAVTANRRTTSVDKLADILSPGANEWGVVQFYRLVDGKYGAIGDSAAWDCSSSDWRDRWTSQPELYCRQSFLEVLDKRTTSAQSIDPAGVAMAWGINPSKRR